MSLTPAQKRAVAARGNVLVMAGAGTGKTSTLVARCIHCLSDFPNGSDPTSLDELLVVTFTEAAAAEARGRIRAALEAKLAATGGEHWARQLALFDAAHIGTLHSFCFKLVRQHFYQLGLDPQVAVLDAGQARLLAEETLGELLDEHYAGKLPDSAAVQQLLESYAGGGDRDEPLRRLVQRLHAYSQTRADSAAWLARQVGMFSADDPQPWREWLLSGITRWRDTWQQDLQRLAVDNPKAQECAEIFAALPVHFTREQAAFVVARIAAAATGPWPPQKKGVLEKPLKELFAEAEFLHTLAPTAAAADPLVEDWNWSRGPMLALLQLAKDFAARFRDRKHNDGVVDFHDLEQLALELLWENHPPPEAAAKSASARTPERSVSLSPARSGGEEVLRPRERARVRGDRDKHTPTLQLTLPFLSGSGGDHGTPSRRLSAIAQHCREKIRFVFVDEYQDINAAQDQIIAALSRDELFVVSSSDRRDGPATPPEGRTPNPGNRFLVGDVKQSIYRFRLAEPEIFRGYARDWRGPAGQTIPLAENFRSRNGILNFVNAVFTPLLSREIGGVVYDDDAKLIPAGRGAEPSREPEVEILFRLTEKPAGRESVEETVEDLQAAEKEARHVARRLCQLEADEFQVLDRDTKQRRRVEWRDMAVLLRAPSTKAEGYAKQFERVGVPLEVIRSGFYESLEVADLLNLLRLLDNPLQDVPLLAVLRSPLVGLSLDELATIRLAARGHFWTALARWAEVQSLKAGGHSPESGVPSPELVLAGNHASRITHHLTQFLARFSHWRTLARQGSLSNCLDAILAETHYAEWLRAQERGAQRHANVQRLLRLAEQFDQFQRQGLFRFLRFIEAQQAAGTEPEVAPTPAGNAVRLLSIHQSKGLEFPVVVVADLGKAFNTQDLRAEIIFDEAYGLCPQVKPPNIGARYPSLAHWLARQRQKRELLGEELRLLYVAMTRARDRLILTGSLSRKRWDTLPETWPQLTPRALLNARSAADWLRLWLAQNQTGAATLFTWRELDDAALRADEVQTSAAPGGSNAALSLDDATLANLRARLAWEYPFQPATQRAAKTSVTALRREAAEEIEEEAEQLFVPRRARAARTKPAEKLSAADRGTAHHKFLQHVALALTDCRAGLQAEAQRLAGERLLTEAEAAALDLVALEKFWQSEVGQKIRTHSAHVRRELPFTARFAPAELDEINRGGRPGASGPTPPDVSGGSEEFVVVQGVADLVVLQREEIWLLDFKTDELTANEVAVKTRFYEPQLQLYARALAGIYSRPATNAWLHFLACGETASVAVFPKC